MFFQLQYTFQNVFDEETSQKSMFESIGLPLVDDLLHGKNGNIHSESLCNTLSYYEIKLDSF